jgi:hypothetical protein
MPVTINSFSADRATVPEGQDVVLSWQVDGDCSAIRISPALGLPDGVDANNLSGTSVRITPAASGPIEFTLSAIPTDTSDQPGTATFTVTVVPPSRPPSIDGFSGDPASVHPGDPVNLSWQVSGDFSALQLSPADGLPPGVDPNNLLVSGVQVTPSGGCDVEYTLTAVAKDAGQPAATKTFKVKVEAAPAPRSVLSPRFTDAPTSPVAAGKPFTLSWAIDGWTSDDSQKKTPVLLHVDQDPGDGNGGQDEDFRPPATHDDGTGSTTVTPTNAGTFKYTLYAGSGDGAPNCQTSVTVEAVSQKIVPQLSRDSQDAVARGATFTLQWSIDGYQPGTPVSLLVDGDVGDPEIKSGMSLPTDGNGKGSKSVIPGKSGDFGFRLIVGSSDTGATSEKLTVSVQPAGKPTPKFKDPPTAPVNVGKPFTLAWTIADFEKETPIILQVDPDPGDGNGTQDRSVGPPMTREEDGVGSIEITPTKTGSFKYTLCAGTGDGAPTDGITVVVEYGVARPLSFTARPEPDDGQQHQSSLQVDVDSAVVLSWTVENCEKVEITPGIGVVDASHGKYTIEHAKGSVDYNLVAIAGDQRVPYSKPVHVSTHAKGEVYSHHAFVSAGMPEIKSFCICLAEEAAKAPPPSNQKSCDFNLANMKVVLAWEVDGDCDTLEIDPGSINAQLKTGDDGKGMTDPIDAASISGDQVKFTLTMTAEQPNGNDTYTAKKTDEVMVSFMPVITDFHSNLEEVPAGHEVELSWTLAGHAPKLAILPTERTIWGNGPGRYKTKVTPSGVKEKDRLSDGEVGFKVQVQDEHGNEVCTSDMVRVRIGDLVTKSTLSGEALLHRFKPLKWLIKTIKRLLHKGDKPKVEVSEHGFVEFSLNGDLKLSGEFSTSSEKKSAKEAEQAWLDKLVAMLVGADVDGETKEDASGQVKLTCPDKLQVYEFDEASWTEINFEEVEFEVAAEPGKYGCSLNFNWKHLKTGAELQFAIVLGELDLEKAKAHFAQIKGHVEREFKLTKFDLGDGLSFEGLLQLGLELGIEPNWPAILATEPEIGIVIVAAVVAIWAGVKIYKYGDEYHLENLVTEAERLRPDFVRCVIDALSGASPPAEPAMQEIYDFGVHFGEEIVKQALDAGVKGADGHPLTEAEAKEQMQETVRADPEKYQNDPDLQDWFTKRTKELLWLRFVSQHPSEPDHFWSWVRLFNEDPVRRQRQLYLDHPSEKPKLFFIEFCREAFQQHFGNHIDYWKATIEKMKSGKWGTKDDVDALASEIDDLTGDFTDVFLGGLRATDAVDHLQELWELGQKLREERKQTAASKGLDGSSFDEGMKDDLGNPPPDFVDLVRQHMGLAARDWLWIRFAEKHPDPAERRGAWEKIVGKSPEQSKSDEGNDLFQTY